MSTNPNSPPDRFCDFGNESGVVYPPAAAELRRNSPNGGFRLLESLPRFFGGEAARRRESQSFSFLSAIGRLGHGGSLGARVMHHGQC